MTSEQRLEDVPGKKEAKKNLLSKQRLSAKDDLEPYKVACEFIEATIKKDWIRYGNLLSEKEVAMGLKEIKNPSINAQQYRNDIIPAEMRQNRGPYNELVDFELINETVISDDEVCFVFRYTYSYQGKLVVEDETLWVVRDKVEPVEEEIEGGDIESYSAPRDYAWRVSFHGSSRFGSIASCLQMDWLKRIVSACAVVPSYNDTT